MRTKMFISLTAKTQEWVHVDTVVFAHFILEKRLRNGPKDPAAGEPFYISTARPATWAEVAQISKEEAKHVGLKNSFACISVPQRLFWLLATAVELFSFVWPGYVQSVFGEELGIFSFRMMTNAVIQPTRDP